MSLEAQATTQPSFTTHAVSSAEPASSSLDVALLETHPDASEPNESPSAPEGISYTGIARNSGYYFLSQVATWFMSFLTISIIPRQIGENGMGHLAVLSAAFSPVGALLWLGLESNLTKEIARDRSQSEKLLRACIGLRIALHIPGVLLSFLCLYLLRPDSTLWWLGFWQIMLAFPNSVSGLFRATQTAWEQAKRVSLLDTLSNLTSLITLPLLFLGPMSILVACFIMDLFLLITRIHWVRQSVSVRPIFHVKLWMTMIQGGIPFVLTGLVGTLHGLITTFMLRHYTNDAAVGVQAQASRLLGTFLFVPTVLTPALLPAIARIADSNPEEFRRAQQRVMTLLVMLSLPIVAFIVVLARPLCHLLYGPARYAALPAALQGYALILLPISIVTVLSQFLVAQNRAQVWNWFYMGTVALFAVSCAVFIPFALHRWNNGVIGTALATAFAEGVTAVVAIVLLKIPLLTPSFVTRASRALVATLGMTAVMWLTRDLFVVVPAILGLLVFAALAWRLRILTPDEQEKFVALLRRKLCSLMRLRSRASARSG